MKKDRETPEINDDMEMKPERQPDEQLESEEQDELDIEELKRKASERDEYLERLQRTTADYQNYQKRMNKEREALRQFAIQELAEALVPCLDNFDHAISAATNSSDQAFLKGIKLVEQEFLRTLGNFNIEKMQSVGQKFDPNFHEAVLEEETNKVPHQTVVEEFRPGYTLNGRVIRAAQVKVSRNPKA